MSWLPHRRRARPASAAENIDDAQAALKAARQAAAKAQRDLDAMRAETAQITHQREQNHFAPLVLELMKRR